MGRLTVELLQTQRDFFHIYDDQGDLVTKAEFAHNALSSFEAAINGIQENATPQIRICSSDAEYSIIKRVCTQYLKNEITKKRALRYLSLARSGAEYWLRNNGYDIQILEDHLANFQLSLSNLRSGSELDARLRNIERKIGIREKI